MRNILLITSFSSASLFAETYEDLGMTQTDFNLVSALTGLITGSLLVYSIIKAL